MGAQKNCLNETVLLSTHDMFLYVFRLMGEKTFKILVSKLFLYLHLCGINFNSLVNQKQNH